MSVTSVIQALLGSAPLFTLKVSGGEGLRVVRFSGYEGLSSLFEFRLELAGPDLALTTLIGKPALLQIEGVIAPRHIHGTLSALEYVGESRSLHLYEAELVPWVWRLQHRENCRIFQDKTTPEILAEVLTAAGLPADRFRFNLGSEYEPRNYCVQYRETDLAFISRLMEEDGIFYFFEHEADMHRLIMADYVGAHPPIPGLPALWNTPQADEMAPGREYVREFRFGERMRPGKVSLRDFNLHKPEQEMEVCNAEKRFAELEVYAYPGEFQDPGHGKPHQGQSTAKRRLEALQASRCAGSGASDCPRLTAGHTMTLLGHSRHDLDGDYRIIRVNHHGTQPQVLDQDAVGDSGYSNEFTVTEVKQPYRSEQTTPRPVMGGLQSATVVGPAGEEVHTDEHGRVKVKFHWDRDEAYDETSSCWVRVSQMWAGNGWGALFLPRIGHEVLVDFIEGDPDRPVITGRVYHGSNKTPYALPQHKTKSTIKSESSMGGGGFNELRFEDRKHAEEIFIHAQKDLNTVILNNHSEQVGAHRRSTIGATETITVGASRTSTIGTTESITVGAARTLTVGTTDTTIVGTAQTVTIVQPPPPSGAPPPAIPPTGVSMSDKVFEVTTGEATITIKGPDISLKANGNISLDATGSITIKAGAKVDVSGGPVSVVSSKDTLVLNGPMVKINC